MSITVQMNSGANNEHVVVTYGYEEVIGGNRRYGQYIVTASGTDTYNNLGPVVVDDRDVALFNGLITSGVVSVQDASFTMTQLSSIGSGTIASGATSSTSTFTAPANTGYDVQFVNLTNTQQLVANKSVGSFTVSVASGATASAALNFDYAVLVYNTSFAYADDAYSQELVGKIAPTGY